MNMIERVARALCRPNGNMKIWEPTDYCYTSGGHQAQREGYRNTAKVAIEAMREPNSQMLVAGISHAGRAPPFDEDDRLCYLEDMKLDYVTMIDSALSEGE